MIQRQQNNLQNNNALFYTQGLNFSVLFFLAFAMTFAISNRALADLKPEKSLYFGGLLGASVPDAKNSQARSMLGLSALGKMGSEYGIGGYFLSSSNKETANGTSYNFNYSLYGLQFSYHFDGEAVGAWFGFRYGISKVLVGDTSYSPSHFGFAFGYDHFLTSVVSIGGEASWLSLRKEDALDAFNSLNLLCVLKMWL